MAESWFSLSRDDQVEALEFAAARTGRPAHLFEKDIWVVWVLSAIYESDSGEQAYLQRWHFIVQGIPHH